MYSMRVVSLRRLREFWLKHPDAERPLRVWYKLALAGDWSSLGDVRQTFPHADGVKARNGTTLTVFNVGGNKCRIITRIIYEYRRVYIRAVLTHAEYDRDRWKEL